MAVQDVLGGSLAWVADPAPGPSKLLTYRHPDVPNLGDITRVDWSTVEPVDIITGGSPCFPSGTLIDTPDGFRPIEDIRLGDEVLTHRGRYMPVVQLMRREALDTLAVKVMGAPEFVTTAEHPFYVRTKGRSWNNELRSYERTWSDPEWVPAGHLSSDHFVGFQLDARDEQVAALGVDLARLIGRWLGDGWTRTARRVSSIVGRRGSRVHSRWHQAYICCAHQETDHLYEVIQRAGFRPAISEVTRTVTKFRINSRALVALLSEFGSGAAGKRVPGWVYRLPREDQAALWEGWRDSDGYIAANGAQKVTTVSVQLAHGMARVARNAFRRAVSVHHATMPATCVIEGRTVNQRDQYQVVLPPSNREAFIENDWCWVPVRSTTASAPDHVYNFGVKDDESYTAWGITVHNCQDLSTAGRRAGMTDGTRSNLWVQMREAIHAIRPKLVVWENVRGALSAVAASAVESEPRLLGDGQRGPALRAIGRVVGDLADLGYVGGWIGLRVADLGGCHGRFRVFLVARPADADADGLGLDGRRGARYRRSRSSDGDQPSLSLLPTPSVADAAGGHERRGGKRGDELLLKGLAKHGHLDRFGKYAPAIASHERLAGRPAPDPTEPGPSGKPRLSARFAEFMMCLPDGWVTDVPGLSRSEQLALLGNGVVPPQGAAALRHLIEAA